MNEQEAREYSESLGLIFDGGYRQAAWADKQKIPKALGLTMREWVMQYLGGYVRMSVEQRKAAVLELAAEGTSNAGIGRALGVSPDTVAAVLNDEEPQEQRRRWSQNVLAEDTSTEPTLLAEDAPELEASSSDGTWGEILKGAAKAAREDPLANVYAALKALALIKAHLDPDMFEDADSDERLRVFNSIEEGIATLRRVQGYSQDERAEAAAV